MVLRGDRYELLRPIAAGGMATVHFARSLGAGGFERLVAVKVMHPHLAEETEFVSMFLDEARLAARIRHPNVVATLDVQTDDLGAFLVMEYIEGPSLDKVLRTMFSRRESIPIEIIVKIFLDVLAGLDAAHDLKDGSGAPLNLVHRDVSPQNVLIGVDGIARLTDFGVARAEARLSQRTQTGQLKGKVSYMSPEQAVHAPLDRRSDVYAAGIVLWETLTNQRLLREPTELLTLLKAKEANHKSPREYDALVPAEISDACMVALRKNPEDRYPTAGAFAEALEKAAANDGIAIATTRAVAAFITNCRAHTPAAELLASPSSVTPSIAGAKPRKAEIEAPAKSDPSPSPESSKDTRGLSDSAPVAGMSSPTNTPAHIAAAVPWSPPKRPVHSCVIAGGVVFAICVSLMTLGAWVVLTSDPAPEENAPAEAPSASASALTSSPVPNIEPIAATNPAPSASFAAPNLTANPPAIRGPASPTTKSPVKPSETSPSKINPVYRPPEL